MHIVLERPKFTTILCLRLPLFDFRLFSIDALCPPHKAESRQHTESREQKADREQTVTTADREKRAGSNSRS
jgi:hypothetical protein